MYCRIYEALPWFVHTVCVGQPGKSCSLDVTNVRELYSLSHSIEIRSCGSTKTPKGKEKNLFIIIIIFLGKTTLLSYYCPNGNELGHKQPRWLGTEQ